MKRFILSVLLLSLLLSACNKAAEPTAGVATETLPTETTPPSPTPTDTPEPTPAAEAFTQYQFEMTLDYSRHSAEVIQIIDYVNKSDFNLASLLLVVPPRAFPNAYQQSELSGEAVASFIEDGIRTTIQLSQPLQPGQRATLRLAYKLVFPQRESTFGWTQRQLNLHNWYPFFPPLSGENTWISHDPLFDPAINDFVGEYITNEIADFQLTLRLVENIPGLLVASGANADPIADGVLYTLNKARSLAFSISGQFYREQIDHNGLLIQAYVFEYQKEKAVAMLQIASQAMDLFGEIFGPYHQNQISLVSADFLHNMEMDGMVMLSSKVLDFYNNTPENNLTILVPHELAHQWFYSQVGNDQAMEPWLDEALATYAEYLFYEHYHPELTVWWWDNRVHAHPHAGAVNNSIYDAGNYAEYRSSVYLHGAIFVHDLNVSMGDQLFLPALKSYVAQNYLKIATKADFMAALQAASPDVDIQAIFGRYFSD
ncbi:MAG: M1 family aminopeptidase [Anaerolineaceae bacterium]|nr:M1 family aminopeptidase [Anaerolineaceae bacterium]MDD4043712.1 M1 family aminopeptidase [Anaerolineaceae bacterium]MDD4578609.1 M1 family aminopeptidase [Anaerolineaceae bacterium]